MDVASEDRLSITAIEKSFALFDKNGDGKITQKELKSVLHEMGYNPTKKEIQEIIKELDKNDNGKIEFGEFRDMMLKRYKNIDPEQELINSFSVFDRNGDGFINTEELYETLQRLGEPLTRKKAKLVLEKADLNKDGLIDYREFVKFLTEKKLT